MAWQAAHAIDGLATVGHMPESTQEMRRRRLRDAVAKYESKAALGRALGYRDGAFVRQMVDGERQVSEKTVDAIESLPGMRGWFDAHRKPVQVDMHLALDAVLDAIAAAPDKGKLRTALLALLDDDAPAYRQRLAELLNPPQDQSGKRAA